MIGPGTYAENVFRLSPHWDLQTRSIAAPMSEEFFYLPLFFFFFFKSPPRTSATEQSFVPVDHVAGTLILTYVVISRARHLRFSFRCLALARSLVRFARMCDNRGRESLTYR